MDCDSDGVCLSPHHLLPHLHRQVDRLLINLNHYKHNVGGADPLAALGALDIEEEVEEEKGEEDEGAMDVQGDEEAAGERGGKPR